MDEFKDRIGGIEKLSLLDYPGKLSCILFYNLCNLRCPYCYNKNSVLGLLPTIEAEYIKSLLQNRKDKLSGVVFSGGECTIHGESLLDDISYVKDLGYSVKVDTNGTNPDIIKKAVANNLIDYIALDFKCTPENRNFNRFFPRKEYFEAFKETLSYLVSIRFPFEVRTTVHSDCIDEEDINKILNYLYSIRYKGDYYIQFYFNAPETIGNVNPKSEKLDKNKIIIPDGIQVNYRNE